MKCKLELMHDLYGANPGHKCGDCCSFQSGRYHDRILRKYLRYGDTRSEASDWARSWIACGKYNVPVLDGESPVIKIAKGKRSVGDAPLEGQIRVWENLF
jgi:hypothetical protein